jgi:tRNA dimethylallyltransferase
MTATNIIHDIQDFLKVHSNGIVIIWWATATGKSSMAVELSRTLPCEIISSDSRQFFRGMDIWTDKISQTILNEIPHHQIDMINPDQFYTAWQWKQDVIKVIPEIQSRWKIPLIVGGTWLYVDTLYKNYSVPEVGADFDLRAKWDMMEIQEPWILRKKLFAIDPIEAKKHHPNSTRYIIRALEIFEKTWLTKTDAAKEQPVQRPILMIGLRRERDDSNARIAKRVWEMLQWWLIDEVKWLLAKGYTPELQSMQGIGYKEVVEYLRSQSTPSFWGAAEESREGQEELLITNYWLLENNSVIASNNIPVIASKAKQSMTMQQLQELITIHTQQYAKRQRTWFKRYIADAENNPKDDVVYKVYYL